MDLKILIADDEPPARGRLRSLLDEIGGTAIVGEAANGEQTIRLALELSPDVVLLDVRMPGIGGLEAARHLGTLAEPPAIVFTTAYDEYAMPAFDAQAIGYLLKPVRKEKLEAALAHARRLTRPQLQKLAGARSTPEPRTHIAARQRDGLRLIPVGDILCFLADQKYTTVRHAKGDDLIEESLRALEDELGAAFVRIHRNALVSTRYLERIERSAEGQYFVHLQGCAAPLPVSRRMASELRERFRL